MAKSEFELLSIKEMAGKREQSGSQHSVEFPSAACRCSDGNQGMPVGRCSDALQKAMLSGRCSEGNVVTTIVELLNP